METSHQKPEWLLDLKSMQDSGALERIADAIKNRAQIKIKRTSGEIVLGHVVATGHAGLTSTVVFAERAGDPIAARENPGWPLLRWSLVCAGVRCEPGTVGKNVRTMDLLAWNGW